MPISVKHTAAPGTTYADIRVGEVQVHQAELDVSALESATDDNGSLPPGLPIRENGAAVSGAEQTAYGIVGPEAVKLGDADHHGNVILSGNLNRDMIEANLGRVLNANELAAIANTHAIRLI